MLNQKRTWHHTNILGGAASVRMFGPRMEYRQLQQLVEKRAANENISPESALKQTMQERLLGQVLMTVLCLGSIALACIGVARGWSDGIVVPLALLPLIAQVLVGKMTTTQPGIPTLE